MSPQVPELDPNWFSSRAVLADEAFRSLVASGLVVPTRGSAIDTLDRWLGDFRETLCRRWREGRTAGVSKLELAAIMADTLAGLDSRLPAAVLGVYIVRFSGERLCIDHSPPAPASPEPSDDPHSAS
ncbi:hypothetical protein GCM10009612_47870 [Streptomyces beijiangensis]